MNLARELNGFYYRMALGELRAMNKGEYFSGLSYHSSLYINIIAQMENCTVSKLADALQVTRSAVTLKVKELVRQGAVEKVQSERDRRVYYLRLSPQTVRITRMYDDVSNQIAHTLQQHYTAEQLALFSEILHAISAHEWSTP